MSPLCFLKVLVGDINEAICNHAIHYTIWRKYGALPERFDFRGRAPSVSFYPLRPELVESTYFLYQVSLSVGVSEKKKDITLYQAWVRVLFKVLKYITST